MSSSDYLAVKKRKQIKPYPNNRSSSENMMNNQYYLLSHTTIKDEDGDILPSTRFHIMLNNYCSFSFLWNNRLVQGFQPLYSIKKIQVPEYIKNRYEPPFCWSCFTPYGEILYEIACSVCEKIKFENENLKSETDIIDNNITEYLNEMNHLESDIIDNNKTQYLNEMNYVNQTENINYMFPKEIIEPLFYLTKNQPTYDTVLPKVKGNTSY